MNKEEIYYIIKTDRNTGEIMFSRGDYSFKQWGISHEIIDLIEQLQQENKQLKERIDKAIKKIKAIQLNSYKCGAEHDVIVCEELLNILKGDNK